MYGSLDHDGGRGPFLQSWDVSKLLVEMVELSLFAIPLEMPTFVFAGFLGLVFGILFLSLHIRAKSNHEREQEHVVICAILRDLAQGRMNLRMERKVNRKQSSWLRYRLTTANEYAPRLFFRHVALVTGFLGHLHGLVLGWSRCICYNLIAKRMDWEWTRAGGPCEAHLRSFLRSNR